MLVIYPSLSHRDGTHYLNDWGPQFYRWWEEDGTYPSARLSIQPSIVPSELT